MPVLPISHFTWQVLRTVKRNKKAPSGRALRVVPSRRTKDGTFLWHIGGALERMPDARLPLALYPDALLHLDGDDLAFRAIG